MEEIQTVHFTIIYFRWTNNCFDITTILVSNVYNNISRKESAKYLWWWRNYRAPATSSGREGWWWVILLKRRRVRTIIRLQCTLRGNPRLHRRLQQKRNIQCIGFNWLWDTMVHSLSLRIYRVRRCLQLVVWTFAR